MRDSGAGVGVFAADPGVGACAGWGCIDNESLTGADDSLLRDGSAFANLGVPTGVTGLFPFTCSMACANGLSDPVEETLEAGDSGRSNSLMSTAAGALDFLRGETSTNTSAFDGIGDALSWAGVGVCSCCASA